MATAVLDPRAVQPEYLGPLAERPLAELAPGPADDEIFPGSSGFLKQAERRTRLALWRGAAPVLARILRPEEHVLHVARAIQVPPVLHSLGMGHMWMMYHQVLVVLTERRLIEILLEPRGKAIGTRVRSYDWGSVKTLKQGFASLTLTPTRGKRQVWKLPVRGDRRLLKLLLPRLQGRLQREGEAAAAPQPVWHCPACGAALPEAARECGSCRALFRSSKIAAWLSLAFPGAGLLYAGHPVLAAADLLGEVLLFAVVALGVARAGDPAGVVAFAVIGMMFFIMTKLQSAHLTRILTARTRPDDAARRDRFASFGKVGGALSALALASVFLVAGTLAPEPRHDLEVVDPAAAWSGSRAQTEWEYFEDDATARSQWTHESGPIVTVFAYPLESAAAREAFRTEFGRALEQNGEGTVLVDDDRVPEPFQGFRYVREQQGAGGESLAAIYYFVYDPEGGDVHQLFTVSSADDRERVEGLVRGLLQRARWIDPSPPSR
jgi:hypothetical protein